MAGWIPPTANHCCVCHRPIAQSKMTYRVKWCNTLKWFYVIIEMATLISKNDAWGIFSNSNLASANKYLGIFINPHHDQVLDG
jgi:hypothetical protein